MGRILRMQYLQFSVLGPLRYLKGCQAAEVLPIGSKDLSTELLGPQFYAHNYNDFQDLLLSSLATSTLWVIVFAGGAGGDLDIFPAPSNQGHGGSEAAMIQASAIRLEFPFVSEAVGCFC